MHVQRLILLAALISLASACGNAKPPVVAPAAAPDCRSCEAENAALKQRVAKADAQSQRRQALFEDLKRRLAGLIGSGKLTVAFRRGLIVLQLPNEIVFELGKATLSNEGASTLGQLAPALKSIADRRFLITGHTDNIPVSKKSRFYKSNWELSTMRGLAVLQLLVDSGLAPEQLGAAGFGGNDPVESNETPESRAKNRRTEILVIPNLETLYSGS